jgi:hypothetical protein
VPVVPAKTWNTSNQKPIKSLAEVMREQEEEEARRRQAAAEQAQEDMSTSGLDSRGGVWSSKSAVAPVPLKDIMQQQQKTVDSTGTPKSSDLKPAQEAPRSSHVPQQLSLKEIQAEQLRAAEQEKQARAQQKASSTAAPVVVHVPVAVIAPKEISKEPKTPVSSKGKPVESPKASVSGVWGASVAAPSLKDIQAEQSRQAELQKEQQRAQQAQRVAAAPSFANVATAAVSRPMSLKEIQAEELRSKHSSQPAAAPVPSPSPAAAAAAPVSAPQAPSKNSSSSAGSPVKKVVQVSVAPSPSPARVPAPAPPPVSVAAADDDDMVWDYSPKPVVKPPSRHVFSFPPSVMLHRHLLCTR